MEGTWPKSLSLCPRKQWIFKRRKRSYVTSFFTLMGLRLINGKTPLIPHYPRVTSWLLCACHFGFLSMGSFACQLAHSKSVAWRWLHSRCLLGDRNDRVVIIVLSLICIFAMPGVLSTEDDPGWEQSGRLEINYPGLRFSHLALENWFLHVKISDSIIFSWINISCFVGKKNQMTWGS